MNCSIIGQRQMVEVDPQEYPDILELEMPQPKCAEFCDSICSQVDQKNCSRQANLKI